MRTTGRMKRFLHQFPSPFTWGGARLFLVAAAYMAASYALFRAGLKRYESGNQMGTRL